MLFKVGIGIFFLQLGFGGGKQLSEDCIDFKWQNWFSNPSLSCFLEICALPLTAAFFRAEIIQRSTQSKWVAVLKWLP